jgi:Na+-transporting methylmalonyl-CoA/oxaloacetate decarboxylase gamma subunit
MEIDNWSFGLTLLVVGMGGTFLTLWILGLVMDLLKKVYPLAAKGSGTEKKS